MNHVKQLLTLSTFGVLCLVSCGHQRYTHKALNGELNMYSADINHNGIIEDHPVKVGDKIYRSEKNVTWQESYDALMSQISDNDVLNICADNMNIDPTEGQRTQLARYEILHEAEEMLMDTGAVMPLYNYSDPYLLKPDVSDIYFMGLGTKYLDQLKRNGEYDGTFHVSAGTKADTLDPADNSDSSTSNTLNNCMRGLSYYVMNDEEVPGQSRTHNSTLKWNDKLLDGEPTITRTDGIPTYKFKIKTDNRHWSDGSDVTALDFVYTWHRACSQYHGTWGFIFDCIKGYNKYAKLDKEKQAFYPGDTKCPNGETISGINYNQSNPYEFSVTLTYDCSFFQELCSFTAYAPLQKKKMEGKYINGDGKEEDIDPRGKDAGVSTWWNDAKNWECNGPFKLVKIVNKQTGTFDIVKNNENGSKAAEFGDVGYGTAPKSVIYHLIDDDSAMYMDYKRNKYDMVDSFPTAMTDKIKQDLPNDYRVADQIGNYYFFFNVNDNTLDIKTPTTMEEEIEAEKRRANIRKGLIRLVNRVDMVDTIVKSGATDANGFVSTSIKESCIPAVDGTGKIKAATDASGKVVEAEWHDRNKDKLGEVKETGSYKNSWLEKRNNARGGFWESTETQSGDDVQKKIMDANVKAGIEYIKKGIEGTNVKYDEKTGKFKNFPTLIITTNTGTGHESLCERLQYLYGLYGISLRIETQEWTSFQTYIKNGEVGMARNGWIADFSDARTYLELFTSTSSSNYCQFGKISDTKGFIHRSQ